MADNTRFMDVQTAFYNQLVDNFTTIPLITDNVDAREQTGLDISNGFIRMNINTMDANIASINGLTPRIRTTGAVTFHIMTPQNEAVGDGLAYASQIAQLFTLTKFNGVQTFVPHIDTARAMEAPEGVFWLTPLICGYYYDTNITILE